MIKALTIASLILASASWAENLATQVEPVTIVVPASNLAADPADPTSAVSAWRVTYIPDTTSKYEGTRFMAVGIDAVNQEVISMDGTFDLRETGVQLDNLDIEQRTLASPVFDAYGIPIYGEDHIKRRAEQDFSTYIQGLQ